jgi:hypothetical protein
MCVGNMMITQCSCDLELKIGEALDRALSVLDKALTVETHKIGVLFIDEGQTKQEEILSNTHGSPRYLKVSFFEMKSNFRFFLSLTFSFHVKALFKSKNLISLFCLCYCL